MSDSDSARLRRMATQALDSLQRAGVTHMPKPQRRATPAASAQVAAPATTTAAPTTSKPTAKPAASPQVVALKTPAERNAALDIIRGEVTACRQCGELASTRTQTVFGVGNPLARLCFVGEAPGADEDEQGEPFVGRAGQLLSKIIEACKLKREDVYILNVLKCRPPNNRPPQADEVVHCRGFLDRQLAIIRPEMICCLGGVAAQTLLETDATIGKLRGTFHSYQGIRVRCTYHPAYLLRNPSAKRDVWDDMKIIMAELGVTL